MSSTTSHQEEIISLSKIVGFFWRRKLVILAVTTLFGLGSIYWSLGLPDEYESSLLVVASENNNGGGLGDTVSQLGGLASLAGVNLASSGSNDAAVAVEIIKSRDFVSKMIDKYDLLPGLIAATGWDKPSGQLLYNEDIYSPTSGQWIKPTPEATIPTTWNGYYPFISRLELIEDPSSGVISIAFEHYSPIFATQLVENIVKEINELMRADAINDAEKSVQYLTAEIERTQVAELKAVFYRLIEEQTKNLMLAKVRDDYVFKVVSKAVLPEDKSNPKRSFLVVAITFLGLVVSLLIALVMDAVRQDS